MQRDLITFHDQTPREMGTLEKISGNKKFRRFNLANFYFVANFAKLKRRKNLSA